MLSRNACHATLMPLGKNYLLVDKKTSVMVRVCESEENISRIFFSLYAGRPEVGAENLGSI